MLYTQHQWFQEVPPHQCAELEIFGCNGFETNPLFPDEGEKANSLYMQAATPIRGDSSAK